jgi:hypothetical protein
MIEVDESIRRPKLDSQVFPGDDLPCVLQQEQQDLGRLLLQPDGKAIPPQLGCAALQLEGSEGPILRRRRSIADAIIVQQIKPVVAR